MIQFLMSTQDLLQHVCSSINAAEYESVIIVNCRNDAALVQDDQERVLQVKFRLVMQTQGRVYPRILRVQVLCSSCSEVSRL